MSSPYNASFACFDCRKSFKREISLEKNYPLKLVCPNCGGDAHNFGRHFKAPKKNNKKQWAKILFLFEHGFRFQKIRIGKSQTHHDSIPYPETLEEAREFVVKYKDYAIDE